MLRFVRKLFESKPRLKISHPVLGDLHLEQGAKGPYWMRESHEDGDLSLSVDTEGEAPPTEAQANFFRWIIADLESIYQLLAADLASRHLEMQRKPVEADWHETFHLAGISIPLHGDRQAPWDITFDCLTDSSGNLYTCFFEHGQLAHVAVDT